jgi:hypothetical protein
MIAPFVIIGILGALATAGVLWVYYRCRPQVVEYEVIAVYERASEAFR